MSQKLSAIVLTKNEEKNIRDCLLSLKGWTREIIIVDSFSKDKTLIEAKSFGVKIYKYKVNDFAKRREFGRRKATSEWLLYLDADERISWKLKKEILEKINKQEEFDAYKIPRLNIFFGRTMKAGGWWPDYQTRLFKKKALSGFLGKIHESPVVEGKIGKLENYLIHLSHLSIGKGFQKSQDWTKMEAELLFQSKVKPVKIYFFFKVFLKELFERIFIKFGFLDGSVGWLEGLIQAYNKFLVWIQLWEKQQKL